MQLRSQDTKSCLSQAMLSHGTVNRAEQARPTSGTAPTEMSIYGACKVRGLLPRSAEA